jgi:hypothetical protein
MALQFSVEVRDAQNNAIETTAGASALLRIYDLTAGAPANCAAAITATLLAEMSLPSDWMAASSAGVVDRTGTWQDPSANNAGVADFFRIWNSGGTTCHVQGTVGQGSGDLQLNNTNLAPGQVVTITGFAITAGNA